MDQLDFHNGDLSNAIDIVAVIGSLGDLEQQLFEYIEFWDGEQERLVSQLAPGEPHDHLENVVRLGYRAEWSSREDDINQFAYFPKRSDSDRGIWQKAYRQDREILPYVRIDLSHPLALTPRSQFGRILRSRAANGTGTALAELLDDLKNATAKFSSSGALSGLISELVAPAAPLIERGYGDESSSLEFGISTNSVTSLLRSLQPYLTTHTPPGPLPLDRHGASYGQALSACVALLSHSDDAVVALDDFGSSVSSGQLSMIVAALRRQCSQVWMTSRAEAAVHGFDPADLMRVPKPIATTDDTPKVVRFEPARTRADRKRQRHLTAQMAGAMGEVNIVVVEGPHDRTAYEVWNRLNFERTGENHMHATTGGLTRRLRGAGVAGRVAADLVAR